MPTLAIDDIAVDDAKPFLDDQGGDEAMGAVEERQFPQDVGMDGLQAAAAVAGVVAQDGAAQPVSEARGEAFCP